MSCSRPSAGCHPGCGAARRRADWVFPITIATWRRPGGGSQSALLFGEFGVLTVLRHAGVRRRGVFGLFLHRRLRDNSPENFLPLVTGPSPWC